MGRAGCNAGIRIFAHHQVAIADAGMQCADIVIQLLFKHSNKSVRILSCYMSGAVIIHQCDGTVSRKTDQIAAKGDISGFQR